MTREELKALLIEHSYLAKIMQCRCQTLLGKIEPEHPKDWDGHSVWGVFAWAEHVADLLLLKEKETDQSVETT